MLDGAIIEINSITENYNLAQDVFNKFGSYIPYVKIINNSTIGGAGIGGTDYTGLGGGVTALTIDSFPNGTIVEIINNGNIYGGSGNGGHGNQCNSSYIRGHNGGSAIEVNGAYIINITNNGKIYGGGAGGNGNTVACYCDVYKRGGNGQGYSYGINAYVSPMGGSHGCNSGVSGYSWGMPLSGSYGLGGWIIENNGGATINWNSIGDTKGR